LIASHLQQQQHNKRRWFSGKIHRCHDTQHVRWAPRSIRGRRTSFLLIFFAHRFVGSKMCLGHRSELESLQGFVRKVCSKVAIAEFLYYKTDTEVLWHRFKGWNHKANGQ
jgi:hypothetical protein